MNDLDTRHRLWGRRDFLTVAGWTGVAGSLAASCVAFGRLLFRRAPVDPPSVFRAGPPEDFRPGSVSDRYMADWRVFIVREGDTLFAVHGRCTHLGCTPRWLPGPSKFKCPCHGSGFTAAGVNFEGPAPRPLERAKVWLGRDGQLWVDVAARYDHTRWDVAGAAVQLGTERSA